MMMLGASGVLIGTRFYASIEANGADAAKERIRTSDANGTVRGVIPDWSRKLFWPAPFTARTLVNDHIKSWTGREVELMQRAVRSLPARVQRTIVLRLQFHLTNAEIAEVMGVTVKAVERNITRGLKSLRLAFRRPE